MSRVIVAHPNIQHSLQLAVGLQKADLLMALVTRLYASWQHPPFSHLSWLPRTFRERVERDILAKVRRSHRELDSKKVYTIDTSRALLPIILRRSRMISQGAMLNWLHRNSSHFQQQVADIASSQADVLVCYDRFAYHAFSRLSNAHVKRVLDLSFVHPRTARRILAEEAERWPALSPSLGLAGVTNADTDSIIDEAAMANFVLVGSTFARNSCIENGIDPESVFVVPYGVDSTLFVPRSVTKRRGEPFRYLFVGQIGQRKGICYLMDAFNRLRLANAELWLCGNVMGVEYLLDTMPQGCRYLGYVPNNQLPSIFGQVDAFVFPSILEGFGLVILEAMACGLPVITTSHTGGPDVIDDGVEGFIIPPGDDDALAASMLYLYEHPAERIEMGKAARSAAENHSWDTYHLQAARLFQHILNDEAMESPGISPYAPG